MTKYESIYIIRTSIGEEAIAEKITKFNGIVESNDGVVTAVDTDSLGMRKLAYAIDDETEGYFVLMTFEGNSELPGELERNFKIDENILHYLITKSGR